MKFQRDTLNFCDFIQVFVFTTNHHLNENDILVDFNFGIHDIPFLQKVKSICCKITFFLMRCHSV